MIVIVVVLIIIGVVGFICYKKRKANNEGAGGEAEKGGAHEQVDQSDFSNIGSPSPVPNPGPNPNIAGGTVNANTVSITGGTVSKKTTSMTSGTIK